MPLTAEQLLQKIGELNIVIVPFKKGGRVWWMASKTRASDVPGVRSGHVIDADGEVLHETVEGAIRFAITGD